jgi:hypothetical protein
MPVNGREANTELEQLRPSQHPHSGTAGHDANVTIETGLQVTWFNRLVTEPSGPERGKELRLGLQGAIAVDVTQLRAEKGIESREITAHHRCEAGRVARQQNLSVKAGGLLSREPRSSQCQAEQQEEKAKGNPHQLTVSCSGSSDPTLYRVPEAISVPTQRPERIKAGESA